MLFIVCKHSRMSQSKMFQMMIQHGVFIQQTLIVTGEGFFAVGHAKERQEKVVVIVIETLECN